jgi:hypothetical protein
MSKLRIADHVTLPLEAVTQAIGVLAKRRVGKSYTARRFAEQLLKAGYFATPAPGVVQLTEPGRAVAARVDAPPTIEDYLAEWQRLLGDGADRKLFDAMANHPKIPGIVLTRDELAQLAGISSTSSTTERGFAWLIGLDLLVVAGKGMVKAGPTMFPEGLI